MLRGVTSIYDPFAGTGKIMLLKHWLPDARIYGGELEREWAAQTRGIIIADALRLPFADAAFAAIATSPAYGNRMADHHEAQDASKRITYRHCLGRPLSAHNAGGLQWGDAYRAFHRAAWREVTRVLASNGRFVLNCKNHYRGGQLMRVTEFHLETLCDLGLRVREWHLEFCPGMRFGAHSGERVEHEDVILLVKEDE